MQFDDENLLPISALQHLLYCERQCALIHIERLWAENVLTAQGRHLHERADKGRPTRRTNKPEVGRGVQVVSHIFGIWGKCDVVEFHPNPSSTPLGISALADISPLTSKPTPFPIEYKRGKPKRNNCDTVQLCAQAMCLEEMTNVRVPAGAIFYGLTRRRLNVSFDDALRQETIVAIRRLRQMVEAAALPRAEYEPRKCKRCSLVDLCMPEHAGIGTRADRYTSRMLAKMLEESLS